MRALIREHNQLRLNKSRITSAKLLVEIAAEPKTIGALESAMMPETGEGKKCKLSLRTSSGGQKLALVLSSEDLVSLRAGLNTNLRLASSALKSIRAAKRANSSTRLQKDLNKAS